MQEAPHSEAGRASKFFLIALAHDNLQNYYTMNFVLMNDHKYSLNDLESMIPFEREIYTELLKQEMEKERTEQGM